MRYAVKLKHDAADYSGEYVTLYFVNGKYEGDIDRPDVLEYLQNKGHEVKEIRNTDEKTSVRKTSKKKEG